jgi:hypothetical protein
LQEEIHKRLREARLAYKIAAHLVDCAGGTGRIRGGLYSPLSALMPVRA